MNKKTLRDVELAGKRVLMRVDFNIPVKGGVIQDDTRIRAALPSIQYILEKGGKLILMSHMGRPDEKGITADTTMKIAADRLAELIGRPVAFAADCAAADAEVAALKDGEVLVLENTRYHKEEQAKRKQKEGEDEAAFKAAKKALKEEQRKLAEKLATYGDIYVTEDDSAVSVTIFRSAAKRRLRKSPRPSSRPQALAKAGKKKKRPNPPTTQMTASMSIDPSKDIPWAAAGIATASTARSAIKSKRRPIESDERQSAAGMLQPQFSMAT